MKIKLSYLVLIGFLLTPNLPAKSLWNEGAPINTVLTGAASTKVGEIVTILVQEDNRANDSADGQGSRKQTYNGILGMIWNTAFMGKMFRGNGVENAPQIKFDSNNDFKGQAAVDRANTFNSRIAATIVRIDEVGNYLLEARKTIRIGQEQKTIILSGKVRPRDISMNNTVYSYQVADAEICYLGEGALTKMSNPSLFQKFLNFLF